MTKQGGDRIGRVIDLVGQKFNRLTVEKFAYIKKGCSYWFCNCDCGNKDVVVKGAYLSNGHTKSCGCLNNEKRSERGKNCKKYNTYDLTGEYGIGYTLKGEEFYFDLEDYDKIKDYCWCINTQGYVCSSTKGVFLHRLVTECEDGMVVDHKYGTQTKNDNRKMNLRVCTQHQNSMNNKIPKNNTSGVTGVGWFKNRNKWYARIMVNYKNVHLGYFDNFNDAVRARKEAELKYFGEYSHGYYSQSKEVI